MNYCITYIKGSDAVGVEYADEHPSEDHLTSAVAKLGADFADVCRLEDTQ